MYSTLESNVYTNTFELQKKYLILKLKLRFNNQLYQEKIINYDVFNKMQNILLKKMNKIILDYKK